jgi:hypothetical protein
VRRRKRRMEEEGDKVEEGICEGDGKKRIQ